MDDISSKQAIKKASKKTDFTVDLIIMVGLESNYYYTDIFDTGLLLASTLLTMKSQYESMQTEFIHKLYTRVTVISTGIG